jgi:hypothetical protein
LPVSQTVLKISIQHPLSLFLNARPIAAKRLTIVRVESISFILRSVENLGMKISDLDRRQNFAQPHSTPQQPTNWSEESRI